MRTTRITPEAMGWDTRSHAWNDVEFFEDVKWVDPWEEAVKLHQNYVLPEYSWLDAATYTHTHVETYAQRLHKMEAQMGETSYNTGWRVYVSTPYGVERYDTGIPITVPTTNAAPQTTSFYELTPEELAEPYEAVFTYTEKPVQAKEADEWEPATDEELNNMLGAE